MNISRWVLSVSIAVAVAATASADIRVPGQPYRGPAKRPDKELGPPQTARTASFEVLVATSGGSGTPQLVIPREAVKGLLADAGEPIAPDADRLASAPTGTAPGDDTAAADEASPSGDEQAGVSRTHSIIAGLAMACAVALGGVWIARTRSRTSARGLVLLISASLCLGVGVTAWANVAPGVPPSKKSPPNQSPNAAATSTRLETAFTGKVQVKFVSGDGAVQLVLPHSDLLKLLEKETAKQ